MADISAARARPGIDPGSPTDPGPRTFPPIGSAPWAAKTAAAMDEAACRLAEAPTAPAPRRVPRQTSDIGLTSELGSPNELVRDADRRIVLPYKLVVKRERGPCAVCAVQLGACDPEGMCNACAVATAPPYDRGRWDHESGCEGQGWGYWAEGGAVLADSAAPLAPAAAPVEGADNVPEYPSSGTCSAQPSEPGSARPDGESEGTHAQYALCKKCGSPTEDPDCNGGLCSDCFLLSCAEASLAWWCPACGPKFRGVSIDDFSECLECGGTCECYTPGTPQDHTTAPSGEAWDPDATCCDPDVTPPCTPPGTPPKHTRRYHDPWLGPSDFIDRGCPPMDKPDSVLRAAPDEDCYLCFSWMGVHRRAVYSTSDGPLCAPCFEQETQPWRAGEPVFARPCYLCARFKITRRSRFTTPEGPVCTFCSEGLSDPTAPCDEGYNAYVAPGDLCPCGRHEIDPFYGNICDVCAGES